MSVLDRIGRQALFAFDPETAHGLSIAALKMRPAGRRAADARRHGSKVRVCGLDFPNPLGMAAGYDKNAEVPDALLGARLRLCRGRHGHAAAAAGQSEAAHLPADRGRGGDQPARLQQ